MLSEKERFELGVLESRVREDHPFGPVLPDMSERQQRLIWLRWRKAGVMTWGEVRDAYAKALDAAEAEDPEPKYLSPWLTKVLATKS